MSNSTISKEEQDFIRMHAQDSSPRKVAQDRVMILKENHFNNNEIFANLRKDFSKHFTDSQLAAIVND